MEKNDSFQPTGRRLDNLNRLLKSKHPEDLWVMKNIIPPFLSIVDSSSTLQQQRIVVKELKQLFDAYEFRYGTILENMNPKDTIKLDVPLFIRLLEYAREDAKTDMDLHDLAERAINLSTEGECLGMQDYDSLVGQTKKLDEFKRMQELAGIQSEAKKDIPKGTQIAYAKGKQPEKTAYVVDYNDHPYNKDFCVVVADKDDLDNKSNYFLISKRWIK